MICLGIESTAHTIGVGICEGLPGEIRILANAKRAYRPQKGKGIVPREAADHHAENFKKVLSEALVSSGKKLSQVGLFAFSQGPGIGQCLRVSCAAAKYLSALHKKPILGINHCHAHLEVSKGVLGMKDPLYVYVSGANTQLIVEGKKGRQRFVVLGETLDMGLGNLFDVFAREAGLESPHGSEVAKLAEKGEYFPLPYTVKGMNFAFAGLLTSALRQIGKRKTEDICRSLMETAFAEICEASERALCLSKKKEVLVCGGVAQSHLFRSMLSEVCQEHGARFGAAPADLNADNGAMIAYTALQEWKRGKRQKPGSLSPNGYWRIDQVF
ncbi:MAG: tRNA (adenosine(37)-N6)-threonylcarbamoyltransferase complex transferase subunit TsaD [Candidatus Micrarchaeota archaeon]|nr:tRNA (adenosine(37)-N6)-threonylcarbamoyltransferase complex transferase subunit TsaD [Candidatus Micrarchaeota archaeon]